MTGSRRGGDLRVRSCLSLRKSIGIIGIGLPPTPAVGGLLLMATSLQTSVRGCYRTGLRDVFVGGRFAIAVFMGSHPCHVASRSPGWRAKMNGLRILLLLVPLHLAAATGPASAQATPPEPGTGVGVEGTRPSGPPTLDDREAILAVLRGVEATFSGLDLAGWFSHFHSVFLLMAPDGVAALASEAEAAALVQPLMEGLRARGYARSEMNRATVRLLSPTTALAGVEWSRLGADGEEIERLGATYAFFKGDTGWKIVMVTIHPPETLLEMG